MIEDILVPLFAVGLAELGDKTQLSIFLLSTKTNKYLPLMIGVMLAFLIVDGIAILIGGWISTIVSYNLLKIISGSLFILLGLLMVWESFRKDRQGKKDKRFFSNNPFLLGFVLILLTEWGDKTQIASAIFATQYNPILVLIGTMIALLMLSILAIYLGRVLSKKIDRILMTRIAGIIFIIIGVTIFFF